MPPFLKNLSKIANAVEQAVRILRKIKNHFLRVVVVDDTLLIQRTKNASQTDHTCTCKGMIHFVIVYELWLAPARVKGSARGKGCSHGLSSPYRKARSMRKPKRKRTAVLLLEHTTRWAREEALTAAVRVDRDMQVLWSGHTHPPLLHYNLHLLTFSCKAQQERI